jgi:hypothetical protein
VGLSLCPAKPRRPSPAGKGGSADPVERAPASPILRPCASNARNRVGQWGHSAANPPRISGQMGRMKAPAPQDVGEKGARIARCGGLGLTLADPGRNIRISDS